MGIRADPNQIYLSTTKVSPILLVGPGQATVPPHGWGAVEDIVWRHKGFFESHDLNIDLINSWRSANWLKALRRRPQLIICHYDDLLWHSAVLAWLCKSRLIVISHYPYAAFPEKWNPGFTSFRRGLNAADVFVALSDSIASQMPINQDFSTTVIHNGADEKYIDFNPRPNRGFIYLGKVEPRKRQIEVAMASLSVPDIVFVGPMSEASSEIPEMVRPRFIGERSRKEVGSSLSHYKGLILASDAEADALVLHEARMAGLHIFATAASLGSYSPDDEGITLIRDDLKDLASKLESHTFSAKERSSLRQKTMENASQNVNNERWLVLIKAVLSGSHDSH